MSAIKTIEKLADTILGSTLSNPEQWLVDAITGGSKASSGVKVNYRTALTIAYVWAAQQIISGDVASLPFDVKRREPDDDLVLDRTHRVHRLMNVKVHEDISSYLFRETLTHWALLCGGGMAYILRDGNDRAVQLIPALPGDLVPCWKDGRKVYHQRALEVTYRARDIFHLRGLGDDLGGHPLLTLAKDSFGLAIAQDRYGAQSWKNGNDPKIILKHPRKLTAEEANHLLDTFEERHNEPGRPALASGGLEIEAFQGKHSDAQLVENRRQVIVEVAAWYNMPPHKLGDQTRVGYNGVEAENRGYITQTLRRWLVRWQDEAGMKLLDPIEHEQSMTVLSHDPRPLTDTDTKAITDEVTKQYDSDLITKNEGRKRLSYSRVEDGDQTKNETSPSAPAVDRQPFVDAIGERLGKLCDVMQGHARAKRKKNVVFDSSWETEWTDRTTEYVGKAVEATSTVFSTMPIEDISAVVTDWSAAAATGDVLVPSPDDLAEQVVGELLWAS